uniref:RING-type domain-containing protein n=1 Tax=Strongyloides venezuelensis TaxID=75913 RepID=A0A0K0FZC4_STRVS
MVNDLPFISSKRKAARQTKEDIKTQREKRTRIFNNKKNDVTREEQYTCGTCFERQISYNALNILNIPETIEWIEYTNCFIWHHEKCLPLRINICSICRNIIS